MKLLSIIALSSIACVNAQDLGFVTAFVNQFLFLWTDNFNDFLGNFLDTADPFELGLQNSVDLTASADCGDISATATFTIDELKGMSTGQIEDLRMTRFWFTEAGFAFVAGIRTLEASVSGSLDGDVCGESSSQDFEATAELRNALFSFEIDVVASIVPFQFTLNSVDVIEFSLEWTRLDFDVSDLGEFEDTVGGLTDALEAGVVQAIDEFFIETPLENLINSVLPFSIP